MIFQSIKHIRSHKLVYRGCLVVMELSWNVLSFVVFHQSEEGKLYRGQLQQGQLGQIVKENLVEKTLSQLFDDIAARPDQYIDLLSANSITLRIYAQKQHRVSYTENKNCTIQTIKTPSVSVQLSPISITQTQSISYIRDYHLTKEQLFKQEILKLKSEIYSLMTELQHVTGLIKSQSVQAKNARLQIKELKKELEIYRTKQERRKSSMEFGVECNLTDSQEENSCVWKKLNQKVKNISSTNYIYDINQGNMNSRQINTISIFLEQQFTMKENSQPNILPVLQNQLITKKKCKIPRISSQNVIKVNRLSGMFDKTDRLLKFQSSWKPKVLESA